jgi:hypothetical protein
MTCPICLRETAADPCECGYAFETGDRSVALARAERVHTSASRRLKIGLAFLAAIPPTVIAAALIPGVGHFAGLAIMIELLGGVGWFSRAVADRRAARARIARSTQAELPAARVIPK